MSDFGIRLKQAMDEANMKASELSRASGVGKNLISYYLSGKCLAKQDKVHMLAKALNVDPGWLITGVSQTVDINDRAKIVVPDSERFVKLISYMPQDEYIMVMKAFEKAEKRLKEAEGAGK